MACTLAGEAMGERQRRWHELAGRAFVDRVDTDRGFRLVFRRAPGAERELRDLAALERECCAFADWKVSSTGDELVLEVGGRSVEGTEAVRAMFRSLNT